MKKKRFSTEQIVAVLKQAEMGLAVSDLIRQLGISEQPFFTAGRSNMADFSRNRSASSSSWSRRMVD